jgi:hypothetical protein
LGPEESAVRPSNESGQQYPDLSRHRHRKILVAPALSKSAYILTLSVSLTYSLCVAVNDD